MTEESNQFDISGGSNLIAPNAMTQQQISMVISLPGKYWGVKKNRSHW